MNRVVQLSDGDWRVPMEPVIRKLTQLRELSDEDVGKLERLARRRELFQPGQEVCGDSQRSGCKAILSGWAARVRELPDGRRQIFAFLVPGDIVGIREPAFFDSSVIAMTRVDTADLTLLRDELYSYPARTALQEACAIAAQMDERLLLNHIVRLGRQTASQRLAHILLELGERLAMAQDVDPSQFSLPVTQENLADALGLSLVHMNRTIQTLRRQELMRLQGGRVSLLERERLMNLASFSPLQARSSPPPIRAERRSWVEATQ